jgi:aryl-alcohol dehydrogenase-like predicted oxidoreductase
VETGGNFIDTADGYAMGKSEELLGRFVAEGKLRDKLVIATKFTFNAQPGNPNAGGYPVIHCGRGCTDRTLQTGRHGC